MAIQLLFRPALGQVPASTRVRVLQGFQSSEGFAGDDEQRCFYVQIGCHLSKLIAVDVSQVMAPHPMASERRQGFRDQLRAQK
ncbi:hypothetical protein D3C84_484250 [compost metagenome]